MTADLLFPAVAQRDGWDMICPFCRRPLMPRNACLHVLASRLAFTWADVDRGWTDAPRPSRFELILPMRRNAVEPS